MKRGLQKTKKKNIPASIRSMMMMCVLSVFAQIATAQTYLPKHYFTFDGSNGLADSMGNGSMNPAYFQSAYSFNTSDVGKAFSLGSGGKAVVVSNGLSLDTAVTIEFLFKPSHDFALTTFLTRRDGAVYIKMGYPFIQFITNAQSSTGANIHHDQYIDLNGVGRGSFSYYVDGNYHHFVFKYNAITGVKEIWIDGQNPGAFRATTTAGAKFNPNTALLQNNVIDLSSNTSYDKMNGDIDELALYRIDVPGQILYKHYGEFKQGRHYSFNATTLTVPTPSAITAGIDINEYAPGHPNYTVSAVDQLATFPTPRFKTGHTLQPNFNWIGMEYFGGAYQPSVSTAQAVTNSVNIQKELARNFNYSVLVASNTCTYTQYTDPAKFQGAWVQLANQNPQWKTGAITFWAQLNPQAAGYLSNTGYINNQGLPTQHYIRNASGQFLDVNGNVTTGKYWSPAAPVDSIYKDGLTQKFLLSKLLSTLTRPLDYICENGEVMPKPSASILSNDPAVSADRSASGLDNETYLGNRKKKFALAYRDQFINMTGLANTKYTEYQISGATSRHKYSEARLINKTINGQVYATPDFYPRWASNWYTGVSAWNGWKHIIDGRYYEIQAGDRLYSPFVAAGWDVNEEVNIRPGQWLGLMKVLGMTGAEFYYTGFFNDAPSYNSPNPPPANPAGYAWQAVIPSYAQATTSRYEDILRNGTLLNGDQAYSVGTPNQPGYSFNTGDTRKLVVVRKHNTLNKYAITGTLQPNSNMIGNAELEGDAMITLNGQNLQFQVRRQGSTYIYDLTDAANPVFYQVDGWHEAAHPYRWSKDFNFEAELYDNSPAQTAIKTQKAANSAAGDFRNATTYATSTTGTTSPATLEYNFTPRNTPNYYFWVRARSRGGVSTGLSVGLNGQTAKSIGCIADTAWNWYSVDACSRQAISFLALGNQSYTLQLTPSNANLEIDRVLLSIDPALNLNANQATCNATVASVNTSGPTTFCQGGSVTLTATAGSSYLWSNGATTQSITVANSGNYAVTVNSTGGCAAVSSPVTVSAIAKPTASITASGNTSICSGQNVTLTASAGSSYTWSNGSTSQSITVANAGSYLVTVTNSSGCSATSTAQSVVVNNTPSATVNASGPMTFCQGGSVTLSAPAGYSYTWSNGSTAQQINVTSAGSYSVVVSNGACSSTSASNNVIVNNLPVATVSNMGSLSFCSGNSVQLMASSGSSYLWSNGETTQNITTSTAGTYAVTVTDANGCSAVSSNKTVTVYALPNAVVTAAGSTSFCPGGSVTLNANGGTSYLWSNGSTGNSITVSQAGNYSAVATNSNGCTASSQAVAITQNSTPNASITVSGPTSLAAGQSTILIASGGSSYLWSPTGETTASIQVSTPGVYSVTVTNSSNCSATSSPVTIAQATTTGTASISAVGSTSFCEGGSVTLNATGGTTYLWTPVNSLASSITVNQPGTYYLYSKNTSGQMVLVDSVRVRVFAKPMVPTISITYVPNTAYQLKAYEPSAASYLWSNGATTASVNVANPQTLSVTVTSGFGCTSSPKYMTVNSIASMPCKAADMLTAYDIGDTSTVIGWNPAVSGENFVIQYWEKGTSVINERTINGNLSTYTMTTLAPATTYEWKITTVCGADRFVSAVSSFKTLGAPLSCGSTPQHLRAATIGTYNADLRWYSTTADNYSLQYRAAGSTTWKTRSFTGSTYQTGASLTNLTANTTYEWRIQTTCSGYTTPYSNIATFATLDTCGYLGSVNVLSTSASTATIQWGNNSQMAQVRIRVTEVATGFYRMIILPKNTLNASYTIKNLLPNTAYRVEVRGMCLSGALGAWTTPAAFSTSQIVARLESNNPLMLNGYPSPTSSLLNYSFMTDDGSDYVLKIADLSGRELVQEMHTAASGANAGEINVSHLAKGMYLLIVQKGTLTSHFRFSVE